MNQYDLFPDHFAEGAAVFVYTAEHCDFKTTVVVEHSQDRYSFVASI